MGIHEALGAVDQQCGILRFGVHPALGVVTKKLLHEPIVSPASVSNTIPPVMVGLFRDSCRHLTQTFNMTMLKLVELSQGLFSCLSLCFTEVPPPTKLSDHFWYEFIGDGFVDGFNASHFRIRLGVVRLVVEHTEG